MTDTTTNSSDPVNFLARFTQSDQFNEVFNEGMSLVEETANYLDGPGRVDARSLDRQGSIAYATESMRLTTRLMQLASWLLLQRAISSGELTPEAAIQEKKRIDLSDVSSQDAMSGADKMPQAMQSLIERSMHVHSRIMQLDKMIDDNSKAASNPINDQLNRLTAAFGKTS